jgi:glucose-6-phosphate isomerase
MEEAILHFPEQFDFEPIIENGGKLEKRDKFIICGMGGSHLGAWLLKRQNPNLDLLIHRDYGLPRVPEYFLKDSLIILSSYSGNTEEVLDTAEQHLKEVWL